jgi:hypothetical protein
MMSINTVVDTFNQAVDAELETGDIASDAQINDFESKVGFILPNDLRSFYQDMGSLLSEDFESNCIEIKSLPKILYHLTHDEWHRKLNSMGLIDYIKYSWGNDRFEFDEYLSADFIEAINSNYKGFGLWRSFEILEAAHYFYFDKNGKFGTVYYHQDVFDDLVDAQLKPMLEQSQATQTLEQVIEEALIEIAENILDDE